MILSRTTAGGQHQEIRRRLSDEWLLLAIALSLGDKGRACHVASKIKGVKAIAEKELANEISTECDKLCARKASVFRVSSAGDLLRFSPKDQDEELKEKTPKLRSFLMAAACKKRGKNNTRDNDSDDLVHGTMSAAGVLLNCRSTQMNSHQILTAFQLRQGGATQRTFISLQKRWLCTGPHVLTEGRCNRGLRELWRTPDDKESDDETGYLTTADHRLAEGKSRLDELYDNRFINKQQRFNRPHIGENLYRKVRINLRI